MYIKRVNIYRKEPPLWLKTISKTVFITFIVSCAFVAVFNFIYLYTFVEGKSMYPTLNGFVYADDGHQADRHFRDSVYINRFAGYKRGDLVVFYDPSSEISNKYIVKRLIAIGGDKITITPNKIYIIKNGEMEVQALSEPYLAENTNLEYVAMDFENHRLDSQNTAEYQEIESSIFGTMYFLTLGEDEVFLLGDNREAGGSNDSADYGAVKSYKYIGRVDIIAYQSRNNLSYIFSYFWKKFF